MELKVSEDQFFEHTELGDEIMVCSNEKDFVLKVIQVINKTT